MNKKNSIVLSHKNCFKNYKHIYGIYNNFKKKIASIKNRNFLVAVSGGPDSMALVAMCRTLEYENNKLKFHYVIVNHGIRKNSTKESIKVKSDLKKYKINLKIIDNKKKINNNIQHNARKIRYHLLNEECKNRKIKVILTAHHQDDQIETFLIRLSRGSGMQGLSSMSDTTNLNKQVKIFRPFLQIKKLELTKISKKVFGSYVRDPSNKDQKYLRVKVRKLLPILKKYGIEESQIIKSINNLRSSSNTFKSYFNEIYKKIILKKRDKCLIKKNDFNSLNDEMKLKVLGNTIKVLIKSDYPPRAKKLKNALIALDTQGLKINYTLSGCHLSQNEKIISVQKMAKN